jgi:arylformamidase
MSYEDLTPAQIWQEYHTDSVVTPEELARIQGGYAERSSAAAEALECFLDIPYGPGGARQTLDIFPAAEQGAPLLVFFHGGYWRIGSKEGRRFQAQAFVPRGIAYCTANYRLAPDFTIEDAIADCRASIAWAYSHAEQYGCDLNRIFVCGNSAGGHLVGAVLADDWLTAAELPPDAVKGGCALSGIFDLEPLLQTEANEWLALDEARAKRNSPIGHLRETPAHLVIGCGALETSEFKRQSAIFADAWREKGFPVTELQPEGHNHYSIIGETGRPGSEVFESICAMIEEK